MSDGSYYDDGVRLTDDGEHDLALLLHRALNARPSLGFWSIRQNELVLDLAVPIDQSERALLLRLTRGVEDAV